MVLELVSVPLMINAKQVTLYFVASENSISKNWENVGAWVYLDNATNYCSNNSWPGDVTGSQSNASWITDELGRKVFTWTGEIPEDKLSSKQVKVIFNDGNDHGNVSEAGKVNFQTNKDGFTVVDGQYYDYSGFSVPTDTQFELVVKSRTTGIQKIFSMSPSRVREENNGQKPGVGTPGEYSTVAFTVGLKNEMLPGNDGELLDLFVRGKNNNNLQFRPTEQKDDHTSFGVDQTPSDKAAYNGSLVYFGSKSCMDRSQAYHSSNTFVFKKGEGVSYTIGLWNELSSKHTYGTNNISFKCADYSLSLHINKSIAQVYQDKYNVKQISANPTENEDYYLIGKWDSEVYQTDFTDKSKMVKRVYLNPKDKSIVDSVVYSKIVRKPDGSSFENLYLSFAPKTINERGDGATWQPSDAATPTSKNNYNFIVRAEVQDQFDATAQEGTVFFAGQWDKNPQIYNAQQAVNPKLTDEQKTKYKYYIIRLNVTTSTYRIEFVDNAEMKLNFKGIRTYASKLNQKIPEGCKVFAAQGLKELKNGAKGLHGAVDLRQLNFIPADYGVVLVAEAADSKDYTFEAITDADETSCGSTNMTYRELIQGDSKKWWTKSSEYNTDEFHDYLVAVTEDQYIENGDYDIIDGKYVYSKRNFALNYFRNTAYYGSLSEEEKKKTENQDYLGFFRLEGTIYKNHAYLSLPRTLMDFNGQILGDFDSNNDAGSKDPNQTSTNSQANAKMTLVFDDVDENTTSISLVKDMKSDGDDAYYTLQGIKIMKPTKGIFIYHGKKVVIK